MWIMDPTWIFAWMLRTGRTVRCLGPPRPELLCAGRWWLDSAKTFSADPTSNPTTTYAFLSGWICRGSRLARTPSVASHHPHLHPYAPTILFVFIANRIALAARRLQQDSSPRQQIGSFDLPVARPWQNSSHTTVFSARTFLLPLAVFGGIRAPPPTLLLLCWFWKWLYRICHGTSSGRTSGVCERWRSSQMMWPGAQLQDSKMISYLLKLLL